MSQGGAVEYAAEERDARIRAEKRVAELERWQTVDLENFKRHLAELTEMAASPCPHCGKMAALSRRGGNATGRPASAPTQPAWTPRSQIRVE